MRRLAGVFLAIAAVFVAGSAPVAADTNQEAFASGFPQACTAEDRQAVKSYKGYNFDGGKEVECGDFWHGHNTQAGLGDSRFLNDDGVGEIEDHNDQTSSIVMFNRSPNVGACFIWFRDSNFALGFPVMTFWVPDQQSGSNYTAVWVPDLSEYFPGDNEFSSVAIHNVSTFDYTQSECNAMNDWERPWYGTYYQ